jgi:hypothetical protein
VILIRGVELPCTASVSSRLVLCYPPPSLLLTLLVGVGAGQAGAGGGGLAGGGGARGGGGRPGTGAAAGAEGSAGPAGRGRGGCRRGGQRAGDREMLRKVREEREEIRLRKVKNKKNITY